jgi:hypothetical protein
MVMCTDTVACGSEDIVPARLSMTQIKKTNIRCAVMIGQAYLRAIDKAAVELVNTLLDHNKGFLGTIHGSYLMHIHKVLHAAGTLSTTERLSISDNLCVIAESATQTLEVDIMRGTLVGYMNMYRLFFGAA